MLERIKEMGLEVTDGGINIEGFISVTGDKGKLRTLRKMLDNEGYSDDTPFIGILSEMSGEELKGATDTEISMIMVCMSEPS